MSLDGTYNGLKASIADFLNRQDLTSAIPDFVALAEAQMSRRLLQAGPVRMMMARSDATITDEFITAPNDFMGIQTIYVGSGETASGLLRLQVATPDEINDLKSFYYDPADGPRRFAVVGNSFQFWPWNGASVSAEITYWQRIPPLASNSTNWLLTLHPDAYLYGSLLQASPYLKDDARVEMWSGIFQTILADIVAADQVERSAAQIAMPPRVVA
jgi:hypothetical protein